MARNDLAGEEGIEPSNDGVKVRCLTTWLLPNWGERWGSNPRVPEPQSGALTTSPRPPYLRENSGTIGRGGRIRTHDMRFWRPPFYQLNYAPATTYRRNSTLLEYTLVPEAKSSRVPRGRCLNTICLAEWPAQYYKFTTGSDIY